MDHHFCINPKLGFHHHYSAQSFHSQWILLAKHPVPTSWIILGVLPAQPPVATKTHCSNIVVMWKMFWASLCYLQHGSPAKRTLAFDRAGRLPCLGQDFKTQWFCHGWKSHPFVSWIVRSQKKETSAQLQQDITKRASLMLDHTLCKPPASYNSRHPAFQTKTQQPENLLLRSNLPFHLPL